MDCSLPCSSVHGIFQAQVLEWVAISFSRGIFPTQGLNLGLPHCGQTLYHLSHQGSPDLFKWRIIYGTVVVFAIHPHESATGARVSPILNPPPPAPAPPSRSVVPSTGSECPASRIKPALVICFPSAFHVITYTCQRCPLRSSHSRLLPESDSLCLFCCPAYKIVLTIVCCHFFSSCLRFVNNLVAGLHL